MISHHRYNLLEQPWIPVILENKRTLLSLSGLFENAPRIQSLDIADPLERASIFRMLESIMYRTFRNDITTETTERLMRAPDTSPVTDYLQTVSRRMDLMNEDDPFLQVPGMEPQGKAVDLGLMRLHPSRQRHLWEPTDPHTPVSAGKAARMLIACNAYDVAGIHTGMKGDPSAKAGKSTGRGVASAGGLLLAFVEGETLWETLLLNLAPVSRDSEEDKPLWEHPTMTPGLVDAQPTGPSFAYTYPSRRIRLLWNSDGRCRGAYVTNGNRSLWDPKGGLDIDRAAECEPMAVWAKDEKKGTAAKPYTACSDMVINRPLWSLWDKTMTASRRPRNIDWALNFKDRLSVDFTGVQYGPQAATVADLRTDRFVLAAERLKNDEKAIEIASALSKKAWPLVKNNADPHEAWHAVDPAMREWLSGGEEPQL